MTPTDFEAAQVKRYWPAIDFSEGVGWDAKTMMVEQPHLTAGGYVTGQEYDALRTRAEAAERERDEAKQAHQSYHLATMKIEAELRAALSRTKEQTK